MKRQETQFDAFARGGGARGHPRARFRVPSLKRVSPAFARFGPPGVARQFRRCQPHAARHVDTIAVALAVHVVAHRAHEPTPGEREELRVGRDG